MAAVCPLPCSSFHVIESNNSATLANHHNSVSLTSIQLYLFNWSDDSIIDHSAIAHRGSGYNSASGSGDSHSNHSLANHLFQVARFLCTLQRQWRRRNDARNRRWWRRHHHIVENSNRVVSCDVRWLAVTMVMCTCDKAISFLDQRNMPCPCPCLMNVCAQSILHMLHDKHTIPLNAFTSIFLSHVHRTERRSRGKNERARESMQMPHTNITYVTEPTNRLESHFVCTFRCLRRMSRTKNQFQVDLTVSPWTITV